MKTKLLLTFIASLGLITSSFAALITTATDGDWSDDGIWTGGIPPTSTDDVLIIHEVSVDENVQVNDLQVDAPGILSNDGSVIRINGSMTINGSFDHGDGGRVDFRGNGAESITGDIIFYTLRINNTNLVLLVSGDIEIRNTLQLRNGTMGAFGGSVTLYADETYNGRMGRSDNGRIIGDFTFMKRVERGNGWGIYGMPFDESLSSYASTTGGNMIYSGFSGGANFPAFTWVNTYFYNESISGGDFNAGYVTPSSTGDVVSRGNGFWYYNTDTPFGGGTVVYDQNWTWSMTGSLDVTVPFDFGITYNSSGSDIEDGWNLIANPYPGTMNWDHANWTKTNIDSTVYYFRSSNQLTSTYNSILGAGTNGGNKNIPAGQGFFVKANGAAPSLIAPQGVVVNSAQTLKNNDDDEEEETPEVDNILRLSLAEDEILIVLHDRATNEFDSNIDALKFAGGLSNMHSEYGQNDKKYAVNCLPIEATSVPLFTGTTGDFNITGIESFNGLYDIKLEDLETGITISLEGDYTIPYTPETEDIFENRYVIHFVENSDVASINEVESEGSINITYLNDIINASYILPGNEKATYNVISIDGKTLSTGTLTGEVGTLNLKRSTSIRLLEVNYKGNRLTYKIL